MGLNQGKIVAVFMLFNIFPYLSASEGDRSPFYQKCVKGCVKENCTDEISFVPEVAKEIYASNPVFVWNCPDDCRYHCMWRTVDHLYDRGYRIPKFHGKWPFRRIHGVQEPASVFASFMNLATHVYMYVMLTHKFPVEEVPMVIYWHIFAVVCMHSWIWSMVFHTRDVPFTEFMDYACALSMVMVLFGSAVIRVFYKYKRMVTIVLLACFVFYVNYLRYMFLEKIDYGYNMMVNVLFGTVAGVIWVVWGLIQMNAGRHYAWRVVAFNLLTGIFLGFELFDFPPIFEVWDAHALWHMSTIPLPLLFYRFVMDDMNYLLKTQKLPRTDLKTA